MPLNPTGRWMARVAIAILLGLTALPTPATFASPETLSPEAAAHQSDLHLIYGKLSELQRGLDTARANQIVGIKDPEAFFDGITYMPADKLRQLATLQPRVVDRFKAYLGSEQQAWLHDINQTIQSYGATASGPVKTWPSTVEKLERMTVERAKHSEGPAIGDPLPATLGDLNDLTRGRINLKSLDIRAMHAMVDQVRAALPGLRPGHLLAFNVKDYAADDLVHDPKAPYKGRIHLIIKDVTGGIKHRAFELQVGPQQLSEFWDRRFKVAGNPSEFNIHDAVYKGTDTIKREEELARIGRKLFIGQSLDDREAVTLGQQAVAETTREYLFDLNAAIRTAEAGRDFDYASTRVLRDRIAQIVRALADDPEVPEGLKGK